VRGVSSVVEGWRGTSNGTCVNGVIKESRNSERYQDAQGEGASALHTRIKNQLGTVTSTPLEA